MGEWILYPSIIVFSLPSLIPSFLVSETLDKLTPVMEREGELEGKGWQEGLRSSIEKEELFLMQYTDILKLWALQVMD